MYKYWSIFKISFQQEFAYKLNFILWRFRNVLQIFISYFLWSKIFEDPNRTLFGYDQASILTYIFAIIIVRAMVLSARAIDVSTDIAQGDLSNYLVKPISYFKYWFTRDISSKALNISFAIGEFSLLFIFFRPQLFFQKDLLIIGAFILSLVIAVMIYFFTLFIVSSIPFWAPELGWGGHFLVTIILVEFLSGALFPIDILPKGIQSVIMSLPFPYLIYFPIQVYLGKISGIFLIKGFYVSIIWVFILYFLMKFIWNRGLKAYEGVGR